MGKNEANPGDGSGLAPALLQALRSEALQRTQQADCAHDVGHVLRVASHAHKLAQAEGANVDVAVAAAWLHELFSFPKDHPDSSRSGQVCAEHAAELLDSLGCPEPERDAICECVREHCFSSAMVPTTLEAAILQDADRLDAIGAIGVARCFATCASMKRPLLNPSDPFCQSRKPDDRNWGLDHFYRKLLRIPAMLHTPTARCIAEPRVEFMNAFLQQLRSELPED
jgi:uncharacterized protein